MTARQLLLSFKDGQVSGNGGCNSYGGEYKINGKEIKIRMLVSTLMACTDQSVTDQESAYLKFLGDAQRINVTDSQLQIFRSDGEALTFVRA